MFGACICYFEILVRECWSRPVDAASVRLHYRKMRKCILTVRSGAHSVINDYVIIITTRRVCRVCSMMIRRPPVISTCETVPSERRLIVSLIRYVTTTFIHCFYVVFNVFICYIIFDFYVPTAIVASQ